MQMPAMTYTKFKADAEMAVWYAVKHTEQVCHVRQYLIEHKAAKPHMRACLLQCARNHARLAREFIDAYMGYMRCNH